MVRAAVKAPDLAVAVHRKGPRPQLGGRVVTIAAAAIVIILGGQWFLYH